MVGMWLSASLVLLIDIKTEIFPATVAEFKEMAVQNRTAYFTLMDLHSKPLMT